MGADEKRKQGIKGRKEERKRLRRHSKFIKEIKFEWHPSPLKEKKEGSRRKSILFKALGKDLHFLPGRELFFLKENYGEKVAYVCKVNYSTKGSKKYS